MNLSAATRNSEALRLGSTVERILQCCVGKGLRLLGRSAGASRHPGSSTLGIAGIQRLQLRPDFEEALPGQHLGNAVKLFVFTIFQLVDVAFLELARTKDVSSPNMCSTLPSAFATASSLDLFLAAFLLGPFLGCNFFLGFFLAASCSALAWLQPPLMFFFLATSSSAFFLTAASFWAFFWRAAWACAARRWRRSRSRW